MFFDQILLNVLHHLPTDVVFSIWLKNAKSENIRMRSFFEILESNRIRSNDYIIVECEFRQLGVLHYNLDVKGCTVFDRKGLEIKLS